MTERIRKILDEIRLKTNELHRKLEAEREQNQKNQQELLALNGALTMALEREKEFLEEISDLKMEIENTKSQVVGKDFSFRKEEEIDELVKEIEYCIGQLKK